MTDEDGYWRFCDVIERTVITSPTITSAPQIEKVVLEQHTATGAYRVRSLDDVTAEADHE
ncbi:MAG: hypothetical protein ABEJ81_06730 [Haloferacaceae archaeon]